MILVALLLIAAEVLASLWTPVGLNFYCVIKGAAVKPTGLKATRSDDFSLVNLAFIAIWLVFAYTNRLSELYQDRKPHGWLYDPFVSRLREELGDRHLLQKAMEITGVNAAPVTDSLKKPIRLLIFYAAAYQQLATSFFWEIAWLMFSMSFGLTQIITVWKRLPASPFAGEDLLDEDQISIARDTIHHMDFGQMVPLLLLVLPFLSAIEAIEDMEGTPLFDLWI